MTKTLLEVILIAEGFFILSIMFSVLFYSGGDNFLSLLDCLFFMELAIVNGRIFTISGEIIENGTILIENGKIKDVGVNLDVSNYDVLDVGGAAITPGFIDMHTHTGVWEEGSGPGPGNNDGNEMSSPISPFVRSIDAIHPEDIGFSDARKGGVTTLGITHGSGNAIGGTFTVVKAAGKEVDEMVVREPAGLKMALGENPKRAGEMLKRAPNTRMGIAYLIRKAFYEAIEYRKDWEHYYELKKLEESKPENERKPLREPIYDIGKDVLVRVLNKEFPVRCHAHRADDIRTAIRLADEFRYDLVIEHATEGYKIRETLAKRKIPVGVGPMIGGRSKRELLDMTPENPALLHEAGVKVAIISDSPFTPIQHLRDSVILAVREGFPEEEALKTITINPAEILGISDRVGSIEKGKDADLVIFTGDDPLEARKDVAATIVNGEIVWKNKKLPF